MRITFDEAIMIATIFSKEEEVFFYMDELAISPKNALEEAGISVTEISIDTDND